MQNPQKQHDDTDPTSAAHVPAPPASLLGKHHLGPGEVIGLDVRGVELRLGGGRVVRARLALAHPYEPAVGDDLLVIGDEAAGFWIIGVVSGRGRTSLVFQGDVDLRAEGGTVRIAGDRGLELDAPSIEVRATTLRSTVEAAVETFRTLRTTVRELLSVRAGESHLSVDGTHLSQARSQTLLAEKKVTVNGRDIYLG